MNNFFQTASTLYWRYSGWATLSGIAGMVGIIALLGFSLYSEYQSASQHAQLEVENITQVLNEEVLATVNKADLLLREIQRNVRSEDMQVAQGVGNSRKQKLHALMKSQVDSVSEVEILNVINADGDYIYSSLDPLPIINVTDRDYFKRQRDDSTAGLVISPPLISHRTGKWTIIMSRRLHFEDGRFAGIVISVLNLNYFEQFFRTLNLGIHGVVAMYDKDLRLAARYPSREMDLGKIANLPAKLYIQKGIYHAVIHSKSGIDGIERLHGFRQVGELPLIVIAGIADDDYLSEWHQHIWQYSAGAIIFSLMVLWFGLFQQRAERALLSSEEDLHTIARALKLLSKTNSAVVHSVNEQELLGDICRLATSAGGYLLAWVGFAEHDTAKTVRPVAQSGYEAGYLDNANITWDDTERGQGPVGTAIKTGRTVIIQNFQTNPKTIPWRENATQRGYQSCIALPIVLNNLVLGSLNIYSSKPNAFGKDEVELLEELAKDLSYGIETLRARIEHEAFQVALKVQSEKSLALLHNASDGIHILNPDGNVIEASDSFCAMLGYSRDEVIGMNVSKWDAKLNESELSQVIREQFEKKGRSQFESRHRHKDGTIFDVEVSGFPLELDGKPVLFNSSRDITERKQHEDLIHENELRLVNILNASPIAVRIAIKHGREVVFYNRSYAVLIKNDHAEGDDPLKYYVRPTDYKEVLAELALGNSVINRPIELHIPDSSTVWSLASYMPIQYQGEDAVLGWFYDITERKQAEEDLRITASVFDNAQEAIVITDANNVIIDVNSAFTHITGYSREEALGNNPKMLSSGRQDKRFYSEMWQLLKLEKAWRGEIWNRRKSGEVYAEMLSISAVCDDKGKVQRYVAVFSDISHLKAHEAELDHIAHYDSLTGIPNRVLLADRMKQAIAHSSREQHMLAVCYLDLDGFKPINDTLGHEAGDQVLIEVANRIGNTIRGGDSVARLGGDEFVVLLLGLEQGGECVTTLERLLAAIAQPITVKNTPLTLSVSIGVSIYPLDEEDPDTLLRHADQAMYVAKQSGKNRFHIYDPSLDRRARDQHEFLKSIRHGLEQDQFELYYQPKVNLRTKEMVGAEALIRWRHPERGLLSPAVFLRYIENTDLDIEIGEWVTATALAQVNLWRSTGLDIEVSINISGYHLESPHFTERLQQQLAQYPDMPFGKFQIEVLETVALNDIAIVRRIIESCRNFGVSFALDDFGTGYSSLSYLSKLPVDVLKIDQSFVRDMLEDKGDMAIVQGIIALARTFDRLTVAEGIETADHYRVLLDMGCEVGQGYGIARPMPANDIANWQAKIRF